MGIDAFAGRASSSAGWIPQRQKSYWYTAPPKGGFLRVRGDPQRDPALSAFDVAEKLST